MFFYCSCFQLITFIKYLLYAIGCIKASWIKAIKHWKKHFKTKMSTESPIFLSTLILILFTNYQFSTLSVRWDYFPFRAEDDWWPMRIYLGIRKDAQYQIWKVVWFSLRLWLITFDVENNFFAVNFWLLLFELESNGFWFLNWNYMAYGF